MPRILFRDLVATNVIPIRCAESCIKDFNVHHDHMLDFIENEITERLSPTVAGVLWKRPDNSTRYKKFIEEKHEEVNEAIDTYFIRPGQPLLRFAPVNVCTCLNPKDGHGKPTARKRFAFEDEVTYWSMTPSELQQRFDGSQTWEQIFEQNEDDRLERFIHALALADDIVANLA